MRALVIAPQPFFSPRGTPFSVYYRTLLLAELETDVDLLTYGQGEDVALPRVRIVRIPDFPRLGPVKVGPSLLKLFLDMFLLVWTIALLLRRRYDFVHAHEEAVFYCVLLKPIFRFKLVYDMHSSLPQQLRSFGFTRSRLLIGLFERLEDAALRRSDAVITISPALADYAVARIPDPCRHVLIENSIFEPVLTSNAHTTRTLSDADTIDEILAKLPKSAPVIAYAGTLEDYQGIDLLLEAHALILARIPRAFLLVVGGSLEQVDRYRTRSEELDTASHTLFTGRLPHETTRSLLGRASVLTSPRLVGDNTPLKLYEQLASGTPLVATRILAHTQILDDGVCFLAEPEPRDFAAQLERALTDQSRRAAVVDAARALYAERYSRSSYEIKVRTLLEILS